MEWRTLQNEQWCQRQDLNLRPRAYESPALPLSYSGSCQNAGENLRKAKFSLFEFIMTSCLLEVLFGNGAASRFQEISPVRLLGGEIAAASSFIDS